MSDVPIHTKKTLFFFTWPIFLIIFSTTLCGEGVQVSEGSALGQESRNHEPFARALETTKDPPKSPDTQPPVTRVTMLVGTSRTFTFPEGNDLRVSRRGIVDLYHRGRGIWDITALHGGIVAIETSPQPDPGEQTNVKSGHRIYIEVARKDDQNQRGRQYFWSQGFCQSKGLRCDETANSISGTTESPMVYRLALKSCRAMSDCLFDLKLSTSGESQLRIDLEKSMGPSYHIISSPKFPWIVRSACDASSIIKDRDEINLRTDAAIQDGLLVLQCLGEGTDNTYDLHTMIFLATTDTANEKGASGVAQIKLGLDTRHMSAGDPLAGEIRRILSDVAKERTIRVISEPITRVRAGATMEIQSGGEFPFDVRGEEAAQGWKSHGLTIKANVTQQPKDLHLLDIHATLRLKESIGSKNLAIQSFKSQIEMPLGVPILAGTIDLESEDISESDAAWLAKIPILGPFFRQNSETRHHSRLILITRLTRPV